MEVKDLRVGNLVLDGISMAIRRVSGFQGNTIFIQPETPINETSLIPENADGTYNINPIPIDRKWLEKFGFERLLHDTPDKDSDFYWKGTIVLYEYTDGNLYLAVDDNHGCVPFVNTISVKYIHQLQNLCFALTGDELGITNSRIERLAEFEIKLKNAKIGDSISIDLGNDLNEAEIQNRVTRKCNQLDCYSNFVKNKNILIYRLTSNKS